MSNFNTKILGIETVLNLITKWGGVLFAQSLGVYLVLSSISKDFDIVPISFGAGLLMFGVVIEYLVWLRKTRLTSQSIKDLIKHDKDFKNAVIEIYKIGIQEAPKTKGPEKE